jgi:hypothetical protein
LVSCAADTWWWATLEKLNSNRDTQPTRNILEKENVIVIVALGNQYENNRRMHNENVKNGNHYNSASINSKLNNKITVVWYNSWWDGNYFSPEGYWWLWSALPIWYEKDKWNIVMPMIPLITKIIKKVILQLHHFLLLWRVEWYEMRYLLSWLLIHESQLRMLWPSYVTATSEKKHSNIWVCHKDENKMKRQMVSSKMVDSGTSSRCKIY